VTTPDLLTLAREFERFIWKEAADPPASELAQSFSDAILKCSLQESLRKPTIFEHDSTDRA
jgi:hypothetical protein